MDEAQLIDKCPFCGNEPRLTAGNEHHYIGGYEIGLTLECSSCSAKMSTCYGEYGATEITRSEAESYLIEKWNNRRGK
jgi:hypothetical protein